MGPLMGQRVSYGATYGAEGHFWGQLWGRGSLLVPLMGQRVSYGASYGAEESLMGQRATYGADRGAWRRSPSGRYVGKRWERNWGLAEIPGHDSSVGVPTTPKRPQFTPK